MKKPELVLQTGGEKHQVLRYELSGYACSEVVWELPDGSVRVPQEKTQRVHYPGPFIVAGRLYTAWEQLCAKEDASGQNYRDIYGREVAYLGERFPCFDSFDYAHEKRYYRWFFLRENDKLTRVFYTDERNKIFVTQDVHLLEDKCCKRLISAGWLREA